MKIAKSILVLASMAAPVFAAEPAPKAALRPSVPTDCSAAAPEVQTFAGQLSPSNKTMFCGKFNDAQRTQAMQMASQKDASGKSVMTGDQSVEKVAADNNMMMKTGKSPSGCPVK